VRFRSAEGCEQCSNERRFDALRDTTFALLLRAPMTDGSVEIGKAKRMAIDRPIEPRLQIASLAGSSGATQSVLALAT
jgi:hypothetical protein